MLEYARCAEPLLSSEVGPGLRDDHALRIAVDAIGDRLPACKCCSTASRLRARGVPSRRARAKLRRPIRYSLSSRSICF